VVVIQNTRALIKLYQAMVSWLVITTRTVLNVNLHVIVATTSLSSQLTSTTVTTTTVSGRRQIAGQYAIAPVSLSPIHTADADVIQLSS